MKRMDRLQAFKKRLVGAKKQTSNHQQSNSQANKESVEPVQKEPTCPHMWRAKLLKVTVARTVSEPGGRAQEAEG